MDMEITVTSEMVRKYLATDAPNPAYIYVEDGAECSNCDEPATRGAYRFSGSSTSSMATEVLLCDHPDCAAELMEMNRRALASILLHRAENQARCARVRAAGREAVAR